MLCDRVEEMNIFSFFQNPAVVNNRTESFSSTENEMEGYRTPPSSASGCNSPVEQRLRTPQE